MGGAATHGAIVLSLWDVAIAAILVIVAGTVSLLLRLGLEKRLAVGATRTVIQLFLVGYILKYVFEANNAFTVVAVATLMVLAATRAAIGRPSHTYGGMTWRSFVTLILVSFLTTITVTGVVVRVEPWYKPQYVIPLLGMVLGNSLTSLSLCLDQILDVLGERASEVEMELALGATAWEAARGPMADAVRRAMIPVINSMMVVGIVALPGMMTGQILQGADPVPAVKYQIVVMFMIAAASSLSSITIALFTFHRLFSKRHQLRSELIRRR